ncbi:MAG: elongation factor P [Chlamydiales bacterium]|nr:elongation factor P [Chlamydiales bacterium]
MAQQISTGDVRPGMKVDIEGQPYNVVSNEFVKPGKGQAFNRIKLKNLLTSRVVERTYKSGEKFDVADIEETKRRMLYREPDGVVFMDDASFDQIKLPNENIGENDQWLLEDQLYDIVFFNGAAISIEPPTFMELRITQTDPGARGDTASGRVLKPAVLETGAKVQIPIFVEEGELVKIDTRTGEYVSRVS